MFAPTTLNVLGIKINVIDHGAVVNLGTSQHLDLFVSYKRNQGIGELNGDLCNSILTSSQVMDADFIDSSSTKSSLL
ncbi:hypothetical protein EM808_12670 [Niallia taxi]|uniref:Uncharacterized protein n=1 Tax=Niallia taxi TaxID=2499688 RepID=A0A3S3SKI8_9BACI|nr:hypothetical protein EM808_12670 [Niallia taxi]